MKGLITVEKKLKVILIILLMVLVTIVGFGGVYVKNLVSYSNIIPNYELGLKLKGSRITILKPGDHVHEIIYDSEGKVVEEIPEGAKESDYRKEQVPENDPENLTIDNYKRVRDIILGRLETLSISNYEMRLNEENGNIFLNFSDTENTDTILSTLLTSGKFEIVDTNDKTVLMTNADVESAGVAYRTETSGITVYLDVKFNKEGKEKIKQISRDYKKADNSEGSEGSSTEKTVTINLNGSEFFNTAFDEEITELVVTIGSPSTDNSAITGYVRDAQYYAAMIANGEMPLEYEVEASDYIKSIYNDSIYIYVLLGVIAILVLASIILMIVRYKKLGILASIVYVGTVSLLLIIIRLTKTVIELDTIVASIVLVLINTYINCKVLMNLKKEDAEEERKVKIYNSYLKVVDLLIIILILSVVFTYNTFSPIASIGMLLFWGIASITIMNVLWTRKLLVLDARK